MSLIHFCVSFYIWSEVGVSLHSFARGSPVAAALFVEKTFPCDGCILSFFSAWTLPFLCFSVTYLLHQISAWGLAFLDAFSAHPSLWLPEAPLYLNPNTYHWYFACLPHCPANKPLGDKDCGLTFTLMKMCLFTLNSRGRGRYYLNHSLVSLL